MTASFVPRRINHGPFVTAYAHAELMERARAARMVLPLCSLGTPADQLAPLGPWVLPPLYHEAMTADLREELIRRIRHCFPFHADSRARGEWKGTVEIVELPRTAPPRRPKPQVFAFSVDTAVEEHGPHLPLATDTIQSYGVLERLATEVTGFVVGAPVDYGQLTWGLPFGFSVDITAPLVTRYVTGFVNAVVDWLSPGAVYVVDVHGSLVHRDAIQQGLQASRCRNHAFRWLYDSLVPFGSGRGDTHAGGIETAIVRAISPELVDSRWWPGRVEELAAAQMAVPIAAELSGDLRKFIDYVESRPLNGIIGNVHNFFDLDGPALIEQMLGIARRDVEQLVKRAAG